MMIGYWWELTTEELDLIKIVYRHQKNSIHGFATYNQKYQSAVDTLEQFRIIKIAGSGVILTASGNDIMKQYIDYILSR